MHCALVLPAGSILVSVVTQKPTRWFRVVLVTLALSVAGTSAALLIRAGQADAAADQAMVDALRQSPGLST